MQVRTDTNIQKLDKFFEISFSENDSVLKDNGKVNKNDGNMSLTEEEYGKHHEQFLQDQESFENRCLNKTVRLDIKNKSEYELLCISILI